MAFPDGWDKHRITINQGMIGLDSGTTPLYNYPVLITEEQLGSAFFSNVLSDGADIRFTTDEDGTNLCPRKILSFNTSTEVAEIEVRIPELSASASTLWVWYDNGSATAPTDDSYTYETTDCLFSTGFNTELANGWNPAQGKYRLYSPNTSGYSNFNDNGKWSIDITNGPNVSDYIRVYDENTQMPLTGDFDVYFDFKRLSYASNTNSIHLSLYQTDWANPFYAGFVRDASGIDYWQIWGGGVATALVGAAGATSGRVKVSRRGVVISLSIWSNGNWVEKVSATGSWSGTYCCQLSFYSNAGAGNNTVNFEAYRYTIHSFDESKDPAFVATAYDNINSPTLFAKGWASLTCTLYPTGANTNGAKWSGDQETWYNSDVVGYVAINDPKVYFKQTSGYTSPASPKIPTITGPSGNTETGTYTIIGSTCNVTVTLDATAISVGGKWSLDSGNSWQDSAVTLAVASGGNHEVTYKPIDEYIQDDPETIYNTVEGENYSVTGVYEAELWPTAYNKRFKITVPGSAVTENLTDFPLRLHLSTDSGVTSTDLSELFAELSNYDRQKMMFWNTTSKQRCVAELVFYTQEDDLAEIYIKTDLVANVDNEIYLYFDKTADKNLDYIGEIGDEVGRQVWVDYLGVYHFYPTKYRSGQYEGQDQTAMDSSANRRHARYVIGALPRDGGDVFISQGIAYINYDTNNGANKVILPGLATLEAGETGLAMEVMYKPYDTGTNSIFSCQAMTMSITTALFIGYAKIDSSDSWLHYKTLANSVNEEIYVAAVLDAETWEMSTVIQDTTYTGCSHTGVGLSTSTTVFGPKPGTSAIIDAGLGACKLHAKERPLNWFEVSSKAMRDLLLTYGTPECGNEGTVKVTILPAGAVSAGAKWSIDGGRTENDSAVTLNHSAGTYKISLTELANTDWGYIPDIEATIIADELTDITVTYISAVGLVTRMGVTGLTGDEIIQRNRSTNDASVPTYVTPYQNGGEWPTLIEGRFVHIDTGIAATTWLTLASGTISAPFNINLNNIPEGGFYRMELRATYPTAGLVDSHYSKKQVGIGILVGLIGQSNVGTWVEPGLEVAPSHHTKLYRHRTDSEDVTWNYSGWQDMSEIRGAAFGNYLNALTGLPVGLLQYCKGGSALLEAHAGSSGYWLDNGTPVWGSSGGLYSKFILGVETVNDIELLVWYQGEAEAQTTPNATTYLAGLGTLFGNLDTDIRPGIPVVFHTLARLFGCASPVPDPSYSQTEGGNDADYNTIRTAQREYIYGDGSGYMVEVQNADVEMNTKFVNDTDYVYGIHISYRGTAVSAIRSAYAAAYLMGYDVSVTGPNLSSCRAVDSTHTIVMINSENTLTNSFPQPLFGFEVLDDGTPVAITSALQDLKNPHHVLITHAAVTGTLTVRYQLKNGLSNHPDAIPVPKDATPASFPMVSMPTGSSITPLTDYKAIFSIHNKRMNLR